MALRTARHRIQAQALASASKPCSVGSLHQRRAVGVDVDPGDLRRAGELAQILAQRGDISLLPHGHDHGAAHRFEGLLDAGFALQDFDDVQAEAAMHEARQNADLGVAEKLLGKFRGAIGRGSASRARRLRRRSGSWTGCSRPGEFVGAAAVVTAHVEQRLFGAFAQRRDIDPGVTAKRMCRARTRSPLA